MTKRKKDEVEKNDCSKCVKGVKLDPTNPIIKADFILTLYKSRSKGCWIGDLAKKFGVPVTKIEKLITLLSNRGYNIIRDEEDNITIGNIVPPMPHLNIKKLRGKEIKFGVVSDTHLCSKYARLDVLEAAYDMFHQQGITEVFHAGNIIDGEFKHNKYEILAHGVHDQTNYLADYYPQRSGIKTFFISADCYDDQTEVMVRGKGFILFSELTEEDEVATLNLDSKNWVWQKPNRLIQKSFEGELLQFSTNRMDYVVTPGHRMFYKRRGSGALESCEAKDFPETAEKQTLCGCNWEGGLPATISVPKIESKNPWAVKNDLNEFPAVPFMRFLGWYIAEGSLDDTKISIGQHKIENQEEIKTTIQQLGFELQKSGENIFSFCSLHLSRYLESLGKSPQRFIPEELKMLGIPLLLELLKAYWKGDGHKDFDTGYASTTSKRLASDLVELGMKCGWAAMFSTHPTVGTQGKIFGETINHNYDEHCVYFNKMTEPWYPKAAEKIPYHGKVYCAQVDNGTLLVRRSGRVMWGSNCHEGWFMKDTGLNVGWYMENWCRDRGRKDLIHIGHLEQDVVFERPGGKFRMRIIHPGGGTPYATSYPSQKMVESFQGGDKPQLLIMGHFHKFDFGYPREVACLLPGTTQDQTGFMRKKKLAAHVGFCICTLGVREDGTLGEIGVKWVPFYDVAYHKHFNATDFEMKV